MQRCPCKSGKTFNHCCEPYLTGKKKALTVSQLMRSRYCSFAMGGHGDYLYRTWHPAGRGSLSATDLSEKSLIWTSLEIIDSTQLGDSGTVEFVAHFEDQDAQQGAHHEISRFVREAGQWLYFDGTIISA